MAANWYIGTSGWSYDEWKRRFYPEGHLSSSKHLPYYSTRFGTTEVNATFYRLMQDKTIQGWYDKTPDDFVFAIKLHQYMTHSKRLKMDKDAEERFDSFVNVLDILKHKAGPVLVQLPPQMKKDADRLRAFLENMPEYRYAIEFRHESWFTDEVYDILKDFNAALVYSHSPKIFTEMKKTADFFYARLHGPAKIYTSKYSEARLEDMFKDISRLKGMDDADVFVYFNNSFEAYAAENALYFKGLAEKG